MHEFGVGVNDVDSEFYFYYDCHCVSHNSTEIIKECLRYRLIVISKTTQDRDITEVVYEFQMSIGASPGEVPTFYPTYDEFKDFSAFIASIEARGAHRVGLAKIVPPKEWQARRMGYKMKQIGNRIVENPIKQEVHGKDGVYSVFNIQQKSVNVNSFQKMAASNRHAPPSAIATDFEKLEKKYWQSLTSVPPIYGAG